MERKPTLETELTKNVEKLLELTQWVYKKNLDSNKTQLIGMNVFQSGIGMKGIPVAMHDTWL